MFCLSVRWRRSPSSIDPSGLPVGRYLIGAAWISSRYGVRGALSPRTLCRTCGPWNSALVLARVIDAHVVGGSPRLLRVPPQGGPARACEGVPEGPGGGLGRPSLSWAGYNNRVCCPGGLSRCVRCTFRSVLAGLGIEPASKGCGVGSGLKKNACLWQASRSLNFTWSAVTWLTRAMRTPITD